MIPACNTIGLSWVWRRVHGCEHSALGLGGLLDTLYHHRTARLWPFEFHTHRRDTHFQAMDHGHEGPRSVSFIHLVSMYGPQLSSLVVRKSWPEAAQGSHSSTQL